MAKRLLQVGAWVPVVMALVGVTASAQQGQQQGQQPPTAPPLASVAQMPPVDKYVVGAAKPPVVAGSTPMDMTLEEAIQIALEKNLDLQVARLNPTIQDYNMIIAQAAFRPRITASFNQQHQQTPQTSTLDGALNLITQTQSYSTGLAQSVPWYGGSYSVQFSSGRTATNNSFSTKNPNLSAGTSFSYTQPVLANRSIDSTRNRIRTQEITKQITDVQLLATIENTKAAVRTAYWNLRQAIERIEIQQRALDLAKQLLANDNVQYQIGTIAGIDLAQPEVAVTQQEQSLLAAQISWQQADLTFKRLLVNGKDDDLYKRTINPVDQALLGGEPSVNIDGAVQTALANRTDVQIARKGIESSQLSLEVTKNATLPQLDLSASYRLTGAGGPTLKNGVITTPGGYFDALGNLVANPTWTLGLNFSYPLGMTQARATLATTQIQLDQSRAQLKVTELTVATDVTTAGLTVQNTYQQYLAAKKSREAQERATDAEQTRFNVGMSNNYNVVQQQNNLTAARLSELQALIAYVNAVADFEKKQRIGG